MQPNGEAVETSCEGWNHGDHLIEKTEHLDDIEGNQNISDDSTDSISSNEGIESNLTQKSEKDVAESWSLHSLLDSVADPSIPDEERLQPTRDAINKLPQGFALPLGLGDIKTIYERFRLEPNAPQKAPTAHCEATPGGITTNTNKGLKRKRSTGSKNPRHKGALSKLEEKDPEQYKSLRNALTKARKLKKRHGELPRTDSPLLQKHSSDMNVVASSANSLNFKHSKPGWIGTQRVAPTQGASTSPKQPDPSIVIDSQWSEEVKVRVLNGWKYIKNDPE